MPTIFDKIFKAKDEDALFDKVNKIVDKLPSSRNTNLSSDDYIDQTIKNEIFKDDSKKEQSDLSEILKDLSIPNDRLERYKTYDEIYHSVQIIKRIFKIYLNNIFHKDPVTNKVLNIKQSQNIKDVDSYEKYKNFAYQVINFYNLTDKLKNITAFNMLKYGDSYIEIVNLEEVEVEFPKVEIDRNSKIKNNNNNKNSSNGKNQKYISDDLDFILEFDQNSELEKSKKPEEITGTLSESQDKLNNLLLNFHSGKSIIPLFNKYNYILGYVEIREVDNKKGEQKYNNLREFVDIINKIGENKQKQNENYEAVLNNLVKSISHKILQNHQIFYNNDDHKNKSKEQLDKEYNENIRNTLDKNVYNTLKKMIVISDSNILFNKKLNVRYIHSNNMFHFRTDSTENYPFGMSIIDPMVYPAKLYLLTQLSNFMTKLSNSANLRKWTIDIGSREDASGMVQKLKNEIKNNKVTAGDLSTSKNIVNIMSEYKDLITFTKKGQRFIDVDTLQTGQRDVHTRDLEEIRKELVAVSGVPSSYLGFEDRADLREELIHINSNFANEISTIQNIINTELKEFIDRIGSIIGFKEKPSDFIEISLIPPILLILQVLESSMNSVSNIHRTLKDFEAFDIDPTYLLNLFIPYIDWNDFIEKGRTWKIKNDSMKPDGGDDDEFGGF